MRDETAEKNEDGMKQESRGKYKNHNSSSGWSHLVPSRLEVSDSNGREGRAGPSQLWFVLDLLATTLLSCGPVSYRSRSLSET